MGLRGILTALLLLLPGAALGAPTVSFIAHRGTAGGNNPAPLYVHFDASATTSSVPGDDAFMDLLYEWDFGDPESGTWDTNGLSKNRAIGGTAAHVYENAGSYTVKLTVTDRTGASSMTTKTVVVTNPETQWSATTVCVSTSGTFAGCPAGGSQVTSSDFDAVMNAQVQGAGKRRILFRRGETFDSSNIWNTPAQVTEALVGAFGAGSALSTIRMINGNTEGIIRLQGVNNINASNSGGWRFQDLKLSYQPTSGFVHAIQTSFIFDNLLLDRMDIGPTAWGFNLDPDQSGLNTPHRYWAVIDTQLRGNTGTPVSNPGSCWFGGASHLFISGVVCGQANSWQMRIAYVHKAVISNNIVQEVAGGFEAIKFHCSIGPTSANPGAVCNHMIFSDNVIPKTRIDITGGGDDMGTIERSIFERNLIAGTIQSGNPNDVFRYNVGGGVSFHNRVGVIESSQPKGNRVENNVLDIRGISSTCVSVTSGTKVDGLLIRNNICLASGAIPTLVSNGGSGTITQQSNAALNGSPFTAANPNRLVRSDYRLPEGSVHINAGVTGIGAALDLQGARAPSGPPDRGASEFQSQTPTPECDEDADCSDGDQCKTPTCNAGVCSRPIVPGKPCNDGSAGTRDDTCTELGACVGIEVECLINADCADANQCKDDICASGICTHPNAANGTACDDSNPATVGDMCTTGACTPGTLGMCTPANCNDSNPCTDDACMTGSFTCWNTIHTRACDDGNPATANDRCWNIAGVGVCQGVALPPPPVETRKVPAMCTEIQIRDN